MTCIRCRSKMYNADDHYHYSFRGVRCPICGHFLMDNIQPMDMPENVINRRLQELTRLAWRRRTP